VKVEIPDTTIDTPNVIIPVRTGDLNGKNITFFKFQLNFESNMIKPNTCLITTGTLVEQQDWVCVLENDLNGNAIIIGYGLTPLRGQGDLLKIRFDVIGKNYSYTPLNFGYFNFNDGDPIAVIHNGKIILKTTNIITNGNEKPSQNILEQNYPNPFNPSTIISFQLSVSGYVVLSVCDVLGKKVMNLIDEYKQPGNYRVIFDGRELCGGVYYYMLKAGEFILKRKMLLIK
jgi:hypothetical protein